MEESQEENIEIAIRHGIQLKMKKPSLREKETNLDQPLVENQFKLELL